MPFASPVLSRPGQDLLGRGQLRTRPIEKHRRAWVCELAEGTARIPCGGTHNIPDGEDLTAPVKNSVQGVLSYNAPTIYQGTAFDNVVNFIKQQPTNVVNPEALKVMRG